LSANGSVGAGLGFAKSVVSMAWARVYCGGSSFSGWLVVSFGGGSGDVAMEWSIDDMV